MRKREAFQRFELLTSNLYEGQLNRKKKKDKLAQLETNKNCKHFIINLNSTTLKYIVVLSVTSGSLCRMSYFH